MLVFSAALIRFALVPGFGVNTQIDLTAYALLVISILCIAAGGNIINDFFDITTDSINKPDRLLIDKVISRQTALKLYFVVNAIGVGLAFYLFLTQAFEQFGLVFYTLVFSPLLLAAYSIWLKPMAIIGNLLVSLLVGLSLFCLGTALVNQDRYPVVFFTIGIYSFLAFLLNLCRELIKDIEDIRGDNFCNMSTLPILIGKKRSNYVVFGLLTFIILVLLSVVLSYFLTLNLLIFYVFVFILLPLILISKQVLDAKAEKDYKKISLHLKLVFLTGICSMLTFLIL
ncbi:geranylgeranylglycerol-phosphate geranylgeranyltransferase [Psychroflexus sediminis]|uniref:4-hydroxybenzoate polyprenyltransferase n=1 Tax=Psychroflexus sediminis TaxID=470826 RepID=A0A1G7V3L1_9FLAO|nr:geranylgeranylglycerol-phosphate geranylgeranyltransferase [Psychroflexus sediminis]SDG54091.1 4-hydroxybenzoate polyprenyltransferase [Psychroflexus sediminis]